MSSARNADKRPNTVEKVKGLGEDNRSEQYSSINAAKLLSSNITPSPPVQLAYYTKEANHDAYLDDMMEEVTSERSTFNTYQREGDTPLKGKWKGKKKSCSNNNDLQQNFKPSSFTTTYCPPVSTAPTWSSTHVVARVGSQR